MQKLSKVVIPFQVEKDRAELAAIVGRNGLSAVLDGLRIIMSDMGERWLAVKAVCDRDAATLADARNKVNAPMNPEGR